MVATHSTPTTYSLCATTHATIGREPERRTPSTRSMARKAELKHPYLKGHNYWGPILTEWIESDRYSEPAKQYFRECLEDMLKSNDLLTIEPQ